MSDIFISYASEDRQSAKILSEILESQGWSVWWDRTIPTGSRYHQVIEDALAAARCVAVIWSRNSVGSDWVRAEAEEGLRRHILVPVCIDNSKPPLIFRQIQTLDLSGLKSGTTHPALERLYSDLQILLGPRTTGQTGPSAKEVAKPSRKLQKLLPLTIAICAGIVALLFVVTHFVPSDSHRSERTDIGTPPPQHTGSEQPSSSLDTPPPQHTGPGQPSSSLIGSGILLAENVDGKARLVLVDRSQDRVTWEKALAGFITCLAQTERGEIIVCDQERILKMGRNGQTLSMINGKFGELSDAKELSDGSLLLSFGSLHSIRQMDWNGQITWSVNNLHYPTDAQRLPDGNTLVADGTNELKLIAENGQVARTISVGSWASAVDRLPNRYTLVGSSGSIILLDQNNNIVWNVSSVGRPGSVQQMASGEFLVADPDNNRIIVLDSKNGKISWSRPGLEGLVGTIELR